VQNTFGKNLGCLPNRCDLVETKNHVENKIDQRPAANELFWQLADCGVGKNSAAVHWKAWSTKGKQWNNIVAECGDVEKLCRLMSSWIAPLYCIIGSHH
jgi:hypothetical protein